MSNSRRAPDNRPLPKLRWPTYEVAGFSGIPATPQVVDSVGASAPVRSKLGRNDPCWCGSGKKYKACHLDADLEKAR